MDKTYNFEAIIKKNPDMDAAYIEVPIDIKKEYGVGRLKVDATFDSEPYQGSIVKMGLPCYIIGITKEIRNKIKKQPGDKISVTIKRR